MRGTSARPGSDTVPIDTRNPTVAVDIVDASLSDAGQQLAGDVHLQRGGGRFDGCQSGERRRHYGDGRDAVGPDLERGAYGCDRDLHGERRQLTPGSVTVAAGSYTDVAGNLGSAGGPDTVPIDTRNPTVSVDIVDASLSDGDNSSLVTFSFSEAVGASTVPIGERRRHYGDGRDAVGPDLERGAYGCDRDLHGERRQLHSGLGLGCGRQLHRRCGQPRLAGLRHGHDRHAQPDGSVDIVDASLSDPDNSSLVTFSFSEAVGASTVANLATAPALR